MTGLRAVVVDDELLAREGLESDLAALGIAVVGSYGDGYSARAGIAALRPDVLFVDVEMPEMNGFALLESLAPEELPPAIVFVTAYGQHALRAFEARALDYLVKPITPARLTDAVQRAKLRVDEASALRAAALPTPSWLSQLIVRDRDTVVVVRVPDLEWIEADTYYVRLHIAGAKPRLLRERISVLEARLDPSRFFRSHRSAIVRLDLVRAIRTTSRYGHSLLLTTGAEVPLGRNRRARLEALLGKR